MGYKNITTLQKINGIKSGLWSNGKEKVAWKGKGAASS